MKEYVCTYVASKYLSKLRSKLLILVYYTTQPKVANVFYNSYVYLWLLHYIYLYTYTYA